MFLKRISYNFLENITLGIIRLIQLLPDNNHQLVSISMKIPSSQKLRNMLFPQQQIKGETQKILLILKVRSVHIFYSMCEKVCLIFKYKIIDNIKALLLLINNINYSSKIYVQSLKYLLHSTIKFVLLLLNNILTFFQKT